MGKVVLVSSQKKDIGKTIICLKIGITLALKGKKVLLVDLSSGKKKMSEYLNVNEDIIYDIKDVLDSTCSIDQAVIEINDCLSLLPCPRIADKLGDIEIEEFTRLFSEVKNEYDIIIADVDKVINSYIDFVLVNFIITVNNNDYSCIKEINSDKHISRKFNCDIICVINKFNKKFARNGTMMNLKDIKKMTEMELTAIIEEDVKYCNYDYDLLFSNENNLFNKAILEMINEINK